MHSQNFFVLKKTAIWGHVLTFLVFLWITCGIFILGGALKSHGISWLWHYIQYISIPLIRSIFEARPEFIYYQDKLGIHILYIFYFALDQLQGNSRKWFGRSHLSCCYSLYNIYISLCTQTAETTSPEPLSWIPLQLLHFLLFRGYFFY